jgi:hypothetical protein
MFSGEKTKVLLFQFFSISTPESLPITIQVMLMLMLSSLPFFYNYSNFQLHCRLPAQIFNNNPVNIASKRKKVFFEYILSLKHPASAVY